MRNRVFLVAAVGLAAVLVAGGLFASNMGFKLNFLLGASHHGNGHDGDELAVQPPDQHH